MSGDRVFLRKIIKAVIPAKAGTQRFTLATSPRQR
jgi:hypothetical protein